MSKSNDAVVTKWESGGVIAKGNPRITHVPRVDDKSIMLEGAKLLFRNFEGRPDRFNPKEGKRSFAVKLDDEAADALERDTWNVKRKPPRSDEEEAFNYLSVAVGDGRYPPKIILISKRKRTRTLIPFNMIDMLDHVEMDDVDLIIRPRRWQDNATGEWRIKAYLKTMFVTVYEDPLDDKYSDYELSSEKQPLGIETSDDPIKVIPGELAEDEDEEP